MRRLPIAVFLLLLLPAAAVAQSGKVFDNLSLQSAILKGERKYAVYLPPDYETSERSYPVLYLLHGATDNHTGWVQFGEVLHITDKAIREGVATPMIIVMPDADTGRMGYYNSFDNSWRYEDFFFEEFMPHVEKTFRIKGQKRYRAIAGLSMGGGGSFIYALHRPDLFSSAAPLSAYVGELSLDAMRQSFLMRQDNLEKASDADVEAYFRRYSVLPLIEDKTTDEIKSVRWYIDCGDDDFLYEGNALTHIALRKKEVPHEYRVRQGGHTWTYWRDSLPEVLRFVSQAFHQY
jgi:enterochelin esterase-like enzyme